MKLNEERIRKYLTPYRYPQPVLTGSGTKGAFDEQAVDIPFVFWHNGKFHMLYTGFDGKGYQSALAVSEDLLHWTHKGIILRRKEETDRWDRIGGSGTWMIKESDNLYDLPRLRKIDGKYWMVYHSYPGTGYESGSAEIGLAWTEDEELLDWHFPDSPVYSWRDGDTWEHGGLYKACIIENDGRWHMFYNAKNVDDAVGGNWIEQTGLAVSDDLQHWTRCGANPLLKVEPGTWHEKFVSDPYIVRDGDVWVIYFFGLGPSDADGKYHAQEGLALSENLIHWEKVEEPILRHGAVGSMDEQHVHKASMVYYKGVLYHFYCGTRLAKAEDKAVINQRFRAIYVAASEPVWEKQSWRNDFINPPAVNRIKPFWFWNGDMKKEEIDHQLKEMAEKGLGGAFICARQGLTVPYLSKEWFELVEYASQRAAGYGMETWLYDEYPYPSGMGGGEVMLRHPEAEHMVLEHRRLVLEDGGCVEENLGWSEVLSAKAYRVYDEKVCFAEAISLEDEIGNLQTQELYQITGLTKYNRKRFFSYGPEHILKTCLPKGKWQIEIYLQKPMGDFKYYGNFFDPCSKEAVKTFLDITHERYRKQVGESFGKTIHGMFSDEVGLLSGIPWSKRLPEFFLEKKGYAVLEAGDGIEAIDLFYKEKDISLIILDIMMPRMDGWQVCREVRQTSKVPVIMLTARSDERDELQGFELGVDEYISKPFSPRILVARVEAVLRRSMSMAEDASKDIGGITIDKSAHLVKVDGEIVDLSFKEFELLTYFVENQGIALSREKILNNVWNYDYFGDARTIDTHVKKLRSKLGEKGNYIKTIWGMGYKFEVE